MNSAKLTKTASGHYVELVKLNKFTRGALKIKKKERHFEKGIYPVPHERSNITASFVQDLKLKKRRLLRMLFG